MGKTITFKAKEDFKEHIDKQAVKKGISTSAYIKAILKKYTKFKEKELVWANGCLYPNRPPKGETF